jgi:hypothetical protein
MMTAREIRDMRARWENEARDARARIAGIAALDPILKTHDARTLADEAFYSYRIAGIAALDLVLGDRDMGALVMERMVSSTSK